MAENKTTIIIPIHKMDDTLSSYFEKAIKSVENQKINPEEVIIVTAKGVKINEEYLKNVNYRIVVNEGNTDFCSQINFGVEQVKTTFFSILEVDDEYSKIWFDNVNKYVEAYDETDVFLPIVLD
ncbi:MAG: glycosyltransferase, partial [bacterium]